MVVIYNICLLIKSSIILVQAATHETLQSSVCRNWCLFMEISLLNYIALLKTKFCFWCILVHLTGNWAVKILSVTTLADHIVQVGTFRHINGSRYSQPFPQTHTQL